MDEQADSRDGDSDGVDARASGTVPEDGGVEAETAVEPSAPTARVGAFLLDFGLVAVALGVLWAVFSGLQLGVGRLVGIVAPDSNVLGLLAVGVVRVVMMVVLGVVLFGYFWYLTEQSGQTYGKRVADVRVVAADGSPVGRRDALLRTGLLLLPLPLVLGLGVFAPLWWVPVGVPMLLGWLGLEAVALLIGILTDDPRRLGDRVADTRVVAA